MNKKLVWLGLVIVLVGIVLSDYSSAHIIREIDNNANYLDFSNTGGLQGGSYDCSKRGFKILGTAGDVLSDLQSSSAISNCSGAKSLPTLPDGSIISMPVDKKDTGNICINYTNVELRASRNNAYVILGGYMYVNNPLASLFVSSRSYYDVHCTLCTGNHHANSYTYLSMYNLNNDYSLAQQVKLTGSWEDYNYSFSPIDVDNSGCYDGAANINISPGVYYVFYIMDLDGADNNDYADNLYTYLSLVKPGNYGVEQNLNKINTSNYTIYPNKLTPDQIVAKYNDTTIDIAFCNQTNGEQNSNITLNSGCCRKKYDGVVSGTYYCADDGTGRYTWQTNDNKNYCSMLANLAGSSANFSQNILDMNKGSSDAFQFMKNNVTGADGCCGDDPSSCYNPTLRTPCLYTDEQSCVANSLCRWRGDSFNVFGYDYGYIDSSLKQFMCYNYLSDLDRRNSDKKTAKDWSWLKASQEGFNIFTLNIYNPLTTLNKTIDTISNGDSWYYCNASTNLPSLQLNGNAIPEGQSPPIKGGSVNMISCVDVMNRLFLGDPVPFVEGCDPTKEADHCCMPTSTTPTTSYSVSLSDIQTCGGLCYLPHAVRVDTTSAMQCNRSSTVGRFFCSEFASGDTINLLNGDYFDKASCLYDMSGCLNDVFSASETCESKMGLNGNLCDVNTNYCLGGKFVDSADSTTSNKCCYGYGTTTKCKLQTLINTSADCSNIYGGIVYDGKSKTCNGQNVSIGVTGQFCCLNQVVSNQNLFGILSLFATVSPKQFICYKDYIGNPLAQIYYNASLKQFVSDRDYTENLLAQCIFDNSSKNLYKVAYPFTQELDYSRGILRGMGASLHVIANYDYFGSNGLVVDRVVRLSMINYGSEPYKRTIETFTRSGSQSYLLFGYTYLEFDIAYPTPNCSLKVVLQTNDTLNHKMISREIDLCPYLATGDRSKRWNHVSIPLKQLEQPISTYEVYDSIVFRDYTPNIQNYHIVLDSITLTPGPTDLALNTPNYYCTGGFGTWIPSLNPPTTLNFSDWNQYGPYQFACDAQAAYSWTGQHCCGFNTRSHIGIITASDYAEFYSDTLSGCFNGSMIKNDWSVSYINNIPEDAPSIFDSFYYKDILYYNNSFIGCQVSNSKYINLTQSFDGQSHTGAPKIVSIPVNNQCEIRGSYYCSDNAWRQLVNLDGVNTDFDGQKLELKTAPAGPELIRYGFRG